MSGGHVFPLAVQLHIGGSMEPTLYKGYPFLVTLGKRHKIPFISLTTNGQLLTPQSILLMMEAGLDEITLSTHGIRRETYERMMKGASFETFHRTLRTIVEMKQKYGKTKPAIRINYTVNPDNLPELCNFFDQYSRYGVTTLQVRPMFNVGATAYEHRDMTAYDQEYNQIIDFLISECRRKGILLLANKRDPTYRYNNKFAVVYDKAVFRYIGPDVVWRDGFDFTSETYRDHMSRIGYRRELLKYVLNGDGPLLNKSVRASSQLFY